MLTAKNDPRLISSGTMATMIGDGDYEYIDKVQDRFTTFMLDNSERFPTWSEGWKEFWMNAAGNTIRLIIAGSRDFDDYELLKLKAGLVVQAAYESGYQVEIVSGGARGADKLGERFAKEQGLKVTPFIPDWRPNGVLDRGAGHKRNAQMAEYGTSLLAFWDGVSGGTANMIKEARKRDLFIDVYVYTDPGNDDVVKRLFDEVKR